MLTTGVPGDPEKYTRDRKKKKMKLQMDGPFPVLPEAPAEHPESAGDLQLMIREFMSVHYRLACGKESTTPWSSMWKHQSTLWDSDMWPSDIMVKDPSKIVLNDCRSIVGLWRQRQAGGASETFRFNFYIDSNGLQPSKYVILTPAGHLLASTPITPAENVEPSPAEPVRIAQETVTMASPSLTPFAINNPNDSVFDVALVDQSTDEVMPQPGSGVSVLRPSALLGPMGVACPAATSPPLIDSPLPDDDTVGETEAPFVNPHSPSGPDVESDPPLGNRKKKPSAAVYSDEEGSSDPSSDNDEARSQRCRAVIAQLALAPLSPQLLDEDAGTLPPRYNKGKKATDKRSSRKDAPPAAHVSTHMADGDARDLPSAGANQRVNVTYEPPTFRTITSGPFLINDGVGRAGVNQGPLAVGDEDNADPHLAAGAETNPVQRPRSKPKPKPRKRQTTLIEGGTIPSETPAEQREREDNLFIVRKSGRTHKPKYNIAPPAQLRLEKEREVNKRKGNHT